MQFKVCKLGAESLFLQCTVSKLVNLKSLVFNSTVHKVKN